MRDNNEMMDRIASFLSMSLRMAGGQPVPPRPDAIAAGIKKLIEDGTFTKDQLRMAALRTCSVIIPDMFFEDVESWRG